MRKNFTLTGLFILAGICLAAQTYSPIAVTGYNQDVIAETPPSALATTTMSMDLSNYIMYSQAFAASVGIPGGIDNTGTIVSGTRTYQIDPFTGNNTLYLGSAATQNLTVSSPSPYSKISLMAFSTEGSGTLDITLTFTDGSTVSAGNFALADWFNGAGAVYCCFGRTGRITGPPYTVDGYPNNPRFYPVDITIPCSSVAKSLETITIAHTTGTYAFIMALSGVPYSFSTTPAVTNVSCSGGANGTAAPNAGGTNGPYTYSWNTTPVQTGATASGLSAGNYICTITDASGCTSTQSFSITQPPVFTAAVAHTNSSCNGGNNGTATVTPSGGTPGYSYSWAPSGGNGPTASGLSPGNYTCTVTDANGCTLTRTFNITQPLALNATVVQSNVACNGGTNGSVSILPYGGTPGYTFLWSPSGATTSNQTGLSAGTYTCVITDANACTSTQQVTITQPTALVTSASNTNNTCYNGNTATASVSASGGTPGYTYSWQPTGGNTANASGLSAGTYTITVNDTHGCSSSQTVVVTSPSAITISTSSLPATCQSNNGSASSITSGGSPGYSYSWAPSGGNAANATGLTSGNYTLTVTDANACVATQTVAVTQTNSLSSTTSSTAVLCSGGTNGSATVTPSGNPPYTFSWSSGGTAATENNLAAGTYTCTITDANGCSMTQQVTVTQPTAITASSTHTNVNCNGGNTAAANVAASGGTGTLSYSWAPSGGTNATANNLSAGTYTCTVTDSNGCSTTQSVTITQPSALTLSTNSDSICPGGSATISASVNGGTSPYTYSWSNAATTSSQTVSVTQNTTYTVTITDANGCITTGTANVAMHAVPVSAFSTNAVNGIFQLANGAGQLCFTNASTGAASWLWDLNGSPSTQQSPCVALTSADSGLYCASLIVVNTTGCADSSDVCVRIGESSFTVPNVFTPNGDGVNDAFIIPNSGMKSFSCEVYSRWGELVYKWDTANGYWDGKTKSGGDAADGVYYYTAHLVDFNDKAYDQSGFVELIRAK